MQETVDKTQENSEQKDSTVSVRTSKETQGSDSVPSWSRIKDRYKNLCRSKVNQDGYLAGIRNAMLTGVVSGIFFMLVSPVFSIFGILLYFYLGTIVGSGISGYRNNLDAFGGFHVGLMSSVPLTALMIGAGMISSPIFTVLTIPLMISYVAMLSASHGIYAAFGREAKGRNKTTPIE